MEGKKAEEKGDNEIKRGIAFTTPANYSHENSLLPVSTISNITSRQEDTPSYKRLKLCKRGYREQSLSLVCGVMFEGVPIWLWAIRLSDWKTVYVSETDEGRLPCILLGSNDKGVGSCDSGAREGCLKGRSGFGTRGGQGKDGGHRVLFELSRDLSVGLKVLEQVLQSSWWEWTFGSSLFFWRWNGAEQQAAAPDGMKTYVHGPLPSGRRGKRIKMKSDIRATVGEKISGMVKRCYLEEGRVSSSLDYFAIPKGDLDVRVVFDGSSCGLNKALWTQFLPSVRFLRRHVALLLSMDGRHGFR